MNYATIAEVLACTYQDSADDVDLLLSLIPRASRIFDNLCGVETDHFGAEEIVASAKVFYGNGTDYLEIGEHGAITSVTMPASYTVPDYVDKDQFLIRTYNDDGTLRGTGNRWWNWWSGYYGYQGWPQGVPVTVTAKFGQEGGVPEDVKEAVIELTIAMWRSRDTAFQRVVQLDGQVALTDAVPPRVKMIADHYRESKVFVFA